MKSLLTFVIRVLAVWRLTELVAEDEISRELREAVDRHGPAKAAYLVSCKRCVSVWAGFTVVYVLPRRWVYALAGSAATILVGDQLQLQSSRALDRRAKR